MHAAERERIILDLLQQRGFIAFRELERQLDASSATIRRDLERMAGEGLIERVRGGIRLIGDSKEAMSPAANLAGVPFHENIHHNVLQKKAIGAAAAALCLPGEGVMIDGGSTTLQMCPHLEGLNLQVLTNSLHIISALLGQSGTRILIPGGALFREQNIILSPAGDDLMPRFHAPKLFMGAAAVGPQGPMQDDILLVTVERRLIERAEEVILLVDSSKFRRSSGHVVCGLDQIDIVVTDDGIDDVHAQQLESSGVDVIIAS